MSTMVQHNGNIPESDNALSRTACFIDESIHRGADSLAGMAHRTAKQIEKAKDYMWVQGKKLQRQANKLPMSAKEHPGYAMMAAGLVGIGLGFALRGGGQGNGARDPLK